MKRILSAVISIVMLLTLAVATNAEAMNMAGGFKTSITAMKANPAAVIKDGIIGTSEYTEVDINRDPATSDLLLSWIDQADSVARLDECGEFLKNAHFYFSWDEVHGLNIAIKVKHLETPVNVCEQPASGEGDDFVFAYGAVFSFKNAKYQSMYNPKNDIIYYRGISKNTTTGDNLIGHYGEMGIVPTDLSANDYIVKIDGNWVTYEVSFPFAAILDPANIVDGKPAEDSSVELNVSAIGGSAKGTGLPTDANGMRWAYAISLGDYGFMQDKWAATDPSSAFCAFSYEEIPYDTETQPVVTTEVITTEPVTEIVTSYVPVTTVDEEGNVVEVTNADGSVVTDVVSEVVTVAPTTTTPGQGTQSPTTGDPMIIAAVVAAISACGIVVAKKRK